MSAALYNSLSNDKPTFNAVSTNHKENESTFVIDLTTLHKLGSSTN